MGREAICAARLGEQRSPTGKALLETSALIYRGDFRVVVPFDQITQLTAGPEELSVVGPAGKLVLRLGSQAVKWADRIRHPPSRLDKLGIKAESRVAFAAIARAAAAKGASGGEGQRGEELEELGRELAARGAVLVSVDDTRPVDVVFLSAQRRKDLGALASCMKRIHPAGAIWILRPKGSAELSEAEVRAAARAAGLVDVKVAAFSPSVTADKFVIPLADRAGKAARAKAAGGAVRRSGGAGAPLSKRASPIRRRGEGPANPRRAPRARRRSPRPGRSTS
jgi:hypothetical protein